MATFPTYAKILLEGYTLTRESAINRTNMESGPPKQLKVKSRVLLTRECTCLFLRAADYHSFITWFQVDTNYGAYWFDWLDPDTDTVKSARIVSELKEETPQDGPMLIWKVGFILETWSG